MSKKIMQTKIYYKQRKRKSKIKIFNDDNMKVLRDLDVDWNNVVIVNDPPFNIKYHYNEYMDDLKEQEYYEWLDEIFSLSNKKAIIHYPEQQFKLSFQMGLFPEKVVSWIYNSNNPRQHRTITFYGIKPNFNNVQQQYKNLSDKRIQERIKNGIKGGRMYDWWFINQIKNVSEEKTEHPAQMPLEVMKRIVATLPEDSIIIDPFMGSGTTGVACKELGVDFIGIEIDKKYYEIAKKRLEKNDIFDFIGEE